jgi:hypothetical protein
VKAKGRLRFLGEREDKLLVAVGRSLLQLDQSSLATTASQ